MKRGEKGQVWVETVTYTLIALVMIGLVLSFAKPKIEEMQDKVIIEQSIQMLKDFDFIIKEVGSGITGYTKEMDTNLKKGSIKVEPANDLIIFEMKSRYQYSQPKQEYQEGALTIYTSQDGKYYPISITLNYSGSYNITYNSLENQKIISKASTPYAVFISNKGGTLKKVDIQVN